MDIIGFQELLLITLVALIVIGPERLPETLRTLGLWFGRLRRSFTSVKAEIEKEIGMDEIKRQLHNEAVMDEMRRIENEVKTSMDVDTTSILDPAAQSTASAAVENADAEKNDGSEGEVSVEENKVSASKAGDEISGQEKIEQDTAASSEDKPTGLSETDAESSAPRQATQEQAKSTPVPRSEAELEALNAKRHARSD